MTSEYTIQELCEQSGLPRRTIHFYLQQGILPPPSGAGVGVRYGEEHLLRLRLIPLLRQQGLRLDEIRQRFERSSPQELEQLARQSETAAPLQETFSVYTTCQHYLLPHGMTLVVPVTRSPADRQKILQLIAYAHRLWGESDDALID